MVEAGKWIVQEDEAGSRLDVFVAVAAGISRARAQQLIRAGAVTLGGRTAEPADRVRPGDAVGIEAREPEPSRLVAEPIPLDMVYEDDDLLVVNKPRGMVVHPAPGHSAGTLVHAVLAHCPDLRGIGGGTVRPGVVHRLDKDTTGLLVVAKTERAYTSLTAQIRERSLLREYLALVRGHPDPGEGVIDAPVGRHPRRRREMAVVVGGRSARTSYRVLERLPGHALVAVRLETGRTHQIRVHFAAIGHPVAGDPVYGGRAGELGLEGQALHAALLRLRHPATGAEVECRAPLPEDFRRALERLRRGEVEDGVG